MKTSFANTRRPVWIAGVFLLNPRGAARQNFKFPILNSRVFSSRKLPTKSAPRKLLFGAWNCSGSWIMDVGCFSRHA
jgi:hypothetical protein